MPLACLWSLALMLAPAPEPSDTVLPLRRVRLHETGIAYFERRGAVTGDRQLALPVPRSHVDDAIKSRRR